MKKMLILVAAVCVCLGLISPVPVGAYQGEFVTVSVYFNVPNQKNSGFVLVELNQALLIGNSEQNLEAIKALNCAVEDTKKIPGAQLLNNDQYPVGLYNIYINNPPVIINLQDPGSCINQLNILLLQRGQVQNILEIPRPNIRIFLETDPNFSPMKTLYSLKLYKTNDQGEWFEPKLDEKYFSQIKKHNKDCSFNHPPSDRILRALNEY